MSIDRLWAGWRSEYLDDASTRSLPPGEPGACVFCRILASGEPDESTYVLWRGQRCAAILNAYPYTSGHLMVLPLRHLADLDALEVDEGIELWGALRSAVTAVKVAYGPGGLNVGANLGRAGGAGIPGHLHLHCLPRWSGDTNFMTSVAEVRVLPESLGTTWTRLRAAWPTSS